MANTIDKNIIYMDTEYAVPGDEILIADIPTDEVDAAGNPITLTQTGIVGIVMKPTGPNSEVEISDSSGQIKMSYVDGPGNYTKDFYIVSPILFSTSIRPITLSNCILILTLNNYG